MKNSFIIAFLLLFNSAFGQEINWHRGSVVLHSNQVIVGDIALYVGFNTLLIKSADQLIVLPSHKISFFRFYDELENINRQFISMKNFQHSNDIFYEVVLQGHIKIVRKLDRTHARAPEHKTDYSYFILYDDNLMSVRSFTRNVIPYLLNTNPDLNQWIKEEKLNLHSLKNTLLVLKEYNRLTNVQHLVASR